jgi:CheY-like chemotaxis protein
MSKKLLLADDSITIQKVVGIIFANEDCNLAVVGDGDSALAAARSERPDLIMADVLMPGKNGYEVCAAVKQDPALRDVPVLLLSGTFEPFDEALARSVGVDDWIVKPFESQALLDKVAELLARVPEPAMAQLPGDDLDEDFDLVEDFVAPVGSDADMWQELHEPSAEVSIAETPPGEPTSLSESGSDDFAESFFSDMESIAESGMPSQGEDTVDDSGIFESSLMPPLSEADTGSIEENVALAVAPGGVDTDESNEGDLWLEESEADEVLFLDEDDILDEELAAEDLAAERTADLAFESVDELSGADADAPIPLSSTDLDAPSVVEESLTEPVAAPAKREGLGFFQNPGLVARLAQPAVAPVEVKEPAPAVEEEHEVLEQAEIAMSEPSAAQAPTVGIGPAEVEHRIQDISEEALTRIVERVAAGVIERLADTILERIAWEVVPDLAEAIIREEIRHITDKV